MNKAQLSADFVITLALILIIFLSITTTISGRYTQMLHESEKTYAKDIAEDFALNLNAIYLAGDGSRMEVFLPLTLKDSDNYEIDIST